MNAICLTGRLTADVELKQTQSGIPVCGFRLAVKRPHTKDETDFINCKAWRNTAEFISRYFSKGKMIAVTGVLTSRKFQDENGKNHVTFEVVVDQADFCGSNGDSNAAQNEGTAPNFEEVPNDSDLPF